MQPGIELRPELAGLVRLQRGDRGGDSKQGCSSSGGGGGSYGDLEADVGKRNRGVIHNDEFELRPLVRTGRDSQTGHFHELGGRQFADWRRCLGRIGRLGCGVRGTGSV